MSTLASMPAQPAGPTRIPWPLYRMSLEQYESLIASGFFDKRDDVHLINGYVVNRMAESPLHGASSKRSGSPSGRSCWLRGIPAAKWAQVPLQVSIPRPTWPWCAASGITGLYPDAAMPPGRRGVDLEPGRRPGDGRDLREGGDPCLLDRQRGRRPGRGLLRPGSSGYRSHEVLAPGHVLSVVIDGVEIGEIAVADILP